MAMTPRDRDYLLLILALVVLDAVLFGMLVGRWKLMDCERGHHERLNGEVVWVYD